MAKSVNDRKKVVKRTNQGGSSPKTSSMTKTQKASYKVYRGQGK
jgi:hypothetical protein